jgi:prepilin-type N-terminal cleavage/methylation domain-containing protein
MSDRGYSLVELLVSVAILLVVFGSVCQLASPAHATALVQAELQDMQQKARVLADSIAFDLRLAGANTTTGSLGGPLSTSFAAILPAACCGSMADSPGAERSDRLTILYTPRGSPLAQTTTEVAPGSSALALAPGPACPSAPLCGFVNGDLLLISDGSGRYDVFRLDLTSGAPLLDIVTAPFTTSYGSGATVARVVVRTYVRDAGSDQVFLVNGDDRPEPLVDRVVDLRFEYSDGSGAALAGRLGDGPWTGTGGSMYDDDVRRVRRVHVTYTIRSGLRGAGALSIADLTSGFDVALRNVAGGS